MYSGAVTVTLETNCELQEGKRNLGIEKYKRQNLQLFIGTPPKGVTYLEVCVFV